MTESIDKLRQLRRVHDLRAKRLERELAHLVIEVDRARQALSDQQVRQQRLLASHWALQALPATSISTVMAAYESYAARLNDLEQEAHAAMLRRRQCETVVEEIEHRLVNKRLQLFRTRARCDALATRTRQLRRVETVRAEESQAEEAAERFSGRRV